MVRILHTHTTKTALVLLTFTTTVLLLGACSNSGDNTTSDAAQPEAGSGAPAPPVDPGTRQTTTTEPIPLPEGQAGDTTAQLAETIPMNSAEAACVADRLHRDENTLRALTEGLDPDSDAYRKAVELAADCTAETTYIPKLIESLDTQLDLTDEQATCLTNTLAAYGPERLTTITLGGTLEDGTNLGTITEACGIQP